MAWESKICMQKEQTTHKMKQQHKTFSHLWHFVLELVLDGGHAHDGQPFLQQRPGLGHQLVPV